VLRILDQAERDELSSELEEQLLRSGARLSGCGGILPRTSCMPQPFLGDYSAERRLQVQQEVLGFEDFHQEIRVVVRILPHDQIDQAASYA